MGNVPLDTPYPVMAAPMLKCPCSPANSSGGRVSVCMARLGGGARRRAQVKDNVKEEGGEDVEKQQQRKVEDNVKEEGGENIEEDVKKKQQVKINRV